MQTITIELSEHSISQAVKELQKYERGINAKYEEVCRRLAELGADEARRRFARADDGNGGVSVTTEKIDKGYKIVASGADVYFIEFGTGYAAGMFYDGDMSGVSVSVYPGSYSEKNKGEFAKFGSWHFDGKKYTQTDAEMPMYYAGKVIRDNMQKVVKEVFK